MARTDERQQRIFELLKELKGEKTLTDLFCDELKYDYCKTPLSRRNWRESTAQKLAEDPVLLATAGNSEDFHIIYTRLDSDILPRGY